MSSEYNSKLISKLYSSQKFSDIEQVLREIEDISDPVFVHPLFDTWSRYNIKTDSFSHYFISTLETINSKDVLEVALKIFDLSTTVKDKLWDYHIFTKFNYIDTKQIDYAKLVVHNYSCNDSHFDIFDFNLSTLCNYLKIAKREADIRQDLRTIFINSKLDIQCREVSLKFLLREDPKTEFDYLISEYNSLRTEDIDILLAKEIGRWKGAQVLKLKELILTKGCDRAIELIKKTEEKERKEQKKTNELQEAKYSNSQIVADIHSLRIKINGQCLSKEVIKTELFNDDESLIGQMETINSWDTFVGKCSDLRDMFNNVQKTVKSSWSEVKMKEILPEYPTTEFNKPINRLFFFLTEKGIKVDKSVFALRDINKVVNLATHPEERSKFLDSLKKIGLDSSYHKEEWSKLHHELLVKIKDSFEKMYLELEKTKT